MDHNPIASGRCTSAEIIEQCCSLSVYSQPKFKINMFLSVLYNNSSSKSVAVAEKLRAKKNWYIIHNEMTHGYNNCLKRTNNTMWIFHAIGLLSKIDEKLKLELLNMIIF